MSENAIISFVNRFVNLTDVEAAYLRNCFEQVRVKNKQYICQPGFTVKHRYYVVKGSFRSFVVDEKGIEHTIALAIDDWWITDYNSYIFQQPATMFVVAMEDSLTMRLSHTKEQELKAASHKFETFFRTIAERGLAYQQRRLISNLTETAEERYTNFMERYSNIAQRVPQYALASFLGMTSEYLSKLRKRQISK